MAVVEREIGGSAILDLECGTRGCPLDIGVGSDSKPQISAFNSRNLRRRAAGANFQPAAGLDRGVGCDAAGEDIEFAVGIDRGVGRRAAVGLIILFLIYYLNNKIIN